MEIRHPISRHFGWRRRLAAAGTAVVLLAPTDVAAADVFPGPVTARVVRVIDGDTFVAEALIWPGHVLTVNIRLRGIDAPELRARCGEEREAALRARRALEELIGGAAPVTIADIASDKYYGRVVAEVLTGEGEAVAPRLLEAHLVRPYSSGARADWCSQGVLTGLFE